MIENLKLKFKPNSHQYFESVNAEYPTAWNPS